MSKERKTFTTASGLELPLGPISRVALSGVMRKVLGGKPLPPVERVETVDGPRDIQNPARSDYQALLESLNEREAFYVLGACIQFGVQITLTEEQLNDVKFTQANNELVNPGAPENKFPVYVYLTTVCTEEELAELSGAILALNTPTEEQVQTHLDAFPGNVPGPSNNGHQNAGVGNRVPDWGDGLPALESGESSRVQIESLLREARPRVAG